MSELKSISLVVTMLGATLGLESDPEWCLAFRHDGPPISKARARVVVKNGRTMAFTPERTETAETALAWRWRLALHGVTYDGNLALAAIFYRPNRQRIDVDNMLKLVLDAGTQARAWHDDCQVTTIAARTELDAECPRTEIALMPANSTLYRSRETIRR